jgi:phage-related protein
MRIQRTILALVALPIAISFATPASAGIFDSVGKVVKGAGKAVTSTAKDVGRGVSKTAKSVGGAASSAAKDVGHAASKTVKTVGGAAKDAGRTVGKYAPKVINTTGTVVSKVYDKAGDAMGHVPVVKEFKPMAKEISRCALTREGKIGGTVGAAAGVVTGGVSSAALAAGRGGLTGCYGKKAYDGAKAEVQATKRDLSDIRRSWRGSSIR